MIKSRSDDVVPDSELQKKYNLIATVLKQVLLDHLINEVNVDLPDLDIVGVIRLVYNPNGTSELNVTPK